MSYELDQAERHMRSIRDKSDRPNRMCLCGVRLVVPGKAFCGICEPARPATNNLSVEAG